MTGDSTLPHIRISCVLLSALCVVVLPASAQRSGVNVTGAWLVDLDPDFGGNPNTIGCTFKQDGQQLTGGCGDGAGEPEAPLVGHVEGEKLTFEFKTGRRNDQSATFTATREGKATAMKGEWHFLDDQRQ